MVGSPSLRFKSGREALPKVQEWSWRHSRRSRSGLEALPEVREWSRGPPNVLAELGGPSGSPGVVGRPSRMSGCGQEAFPVVQKWSGVRPGG